MLSIDGLVTGIDTGSVIEGLLQIQQQQVDRQLAKRGAILGKQAAFSGIEARLFSFRGALGRLTSIATTAINDKTISSSHEDLITGAASDNAAVGTYQLKVERLATAHQKATVGFASPDSLISQGTLTIQVGNQTSEPIEVGPSNNTAQGLVDAINSSDADVSATIIDNGSSGPERYQLLLTSDKTGAANQITINNNLAAAGPSEFRPDFGIDVAIGDDAQVKFGSGAGAITVNNDTNRLDNLIAGVTLNLNGADDGQDVSISVVQDVETARTAVEDFVAAYNELTNYFNDQLRFNTATLEGGPLLGEGAVVAIQNEVQQTISSVVGGVNGQLNRLSAVGISVTNSGTLEVNSSKLEDALAGRLEGVSTNDVARLFALSGSSNNGGFRFVSGSSKVIEGEVEVDITAAATKATAIATNAAPSSITITSRNNDFRLTVDGRQSSQLSVAAGTYTPETLAAELETIINADNELGARDVTVTVENGALRFTTTSLGSASELDGFNSQFFQSIGFAGDEYGKGRDVVGKFIVDGVVEEATGTGNLLVGKDDNEHTDGLQIRVTLNDSQLVAGAEGTLTVSRGIAARLDGVLGDFLNTEKGRLKTVNDRFEGQLESIQESIDRLNDRFDAERLSLQRQFAALETAVAELQTTGNFLTSLLPA